MEPWLKTQKMIMVLPMVPIRSTNQ